MANEKRLIDANALDEKVGKLAERYAAQGRMVVAEDYNFIRTVLMTAPTVDAVEVVRCKDCKHYVPDVLACSNLICCANWYPDDFCSYGERKDNV